MEHTSETAGRENHLCLGVLAHVDGGKTTFSEQLLYHTHVIRKAGRVDSRDTLMDSNAIEKARGITIFADQSPFYLGDSLCYLLDTPGHVDFCAETERAITALDYGILLADAGSGVTAHTAALFRLLNSYKIPAFFFINKTDLDHADPEKVLHQIRERLTENVWLLKSPGELDTPAADFLEFAAERDEELLESYLEDSVTPELFAAALIRLIKKRKLFLCMKGSALKDQGIEEFLSVLGRLADAPRHEDGPFSGLVYKIRHDEKGNRITFIKALSGTIRVKDEFAFRLENGELVSEKVNEIRSFSGLKYTSLPQASAGELLAVTGLSVPVCGTVLTAGAENKTGADAKNPGYLMTPALRAQVTAADGSPYPEPHRLLEKLKILEAEDPQLKVSVEGNRQICVSVMGAVQLEVLKQLIADRFSMDVAFLPPKVLYKETIAAPVMGYGHYEPLRHYAEVNLKLEPAPRGSGIHFSSQCHVDTLALNYQNLIQTHVFEREHRGILTGSPLTDVTVTLMAGRAHIKHTEGGDFREAVYRAIRQGLEKADNVLLEPWYRFEIMAPSDYLGRIMADIQKRAGTFQPPVIQGSTVTVAGRGPAASFMDYSLEMASFTRGSGSIFLMADGYDVCHNPEEVIAAMAYDKGADKENTSCSVFCSHGAGFTVSWDEAERYMHCIGESSRAGN